MFVCWRDRVAYDETTYLETLKRRGSPLASKLNSPSPRPPELHANNFIQNG